jgi:hypothetical protein
VPGEDHENIFHRSGFAVFVEATLIGIGANTHLEPDWVVATFDGFHGNGRRQSIVHNKRAGGVAFGG